LAGDAFELAIAAAEMNASAQDERSLPTAPEGGWSTSPAPASVASQLAHAARLRLFSVGLHSVPGEIQGGRMNSPAQVLVVGVLCSVPIVIIILSFQGFLEGPRRPPAGGHSAPGTYPWSQHGWRLGSTPAIAVTPPRTGPVGPPPQINIAGTLPTLPAAAVPSNTPPKSAPLPPGSDEGAAGLPMVGHPQSMSVPAYAPAMTTRRYASERDEGHVEGRRPSTVTMAKPLYGDRIGLRLDEELVITGIVEPEAAEAGFRPGDRIIAINGQPVSDKDVFLEELQKAISLHRATGRALTFVVLPPEGAMSPSAFSRPRENSPAPLQPMSGAASGTM